MKSKDIQQFIEGKSIGVRQQFHHLMLAAKARESSKRKTLALAETTLEMIASKGKSLEVITVEELVHLTQPRSLKAKLKFWEGNRKARSMSSLVPPTRSDGLTILDVTTLASVFLFLLLNEAKEVVVE